MSIRTERDHWMAQAQAVKRNYQRAAKHRRILSAELLEILAIIEEEAAVEAVSSCLRDRVNRRVHRVLKQVKMGPYARRKS